MEIITEYPLSKEHKELGYSDAQYFDGCYSYKDLRARNRIKLTDKIVKGPVLFLTGVYTFEDLDALMDLSPQR